MHIFSKPEAGFLYVESVDSLSSPKVTTLAGEDTGCLLLNTEKLPDGTLRHLFSAKGLQPWTPETPVLYEIRTADGQRERFGYSEIRPFSNTALLLNGTPLYVRGYIRGIVAHEHPNMTGGTLKDAAVKNIRQARKYGFNLVRFHSTIPTPEFIEAADEEGLLVHMEIGFTYDVSEDGERQNLSMDNSSWRETILRYRNHPSVAIFCIGNEMHNSGHYPEVMALYRQGREMAPGKLILDNSGWGEFDRQSADVYSQHIAYFFPYGVHREMFHREDPWLMNGSAYDEPLDASHESQALQAKIHRTVVPARPVIAHEAVHYIEIPDYDKLTAKFRDFCAKVGPEYLKANEIKEPRFMTEIPRLVERKGLKDKMPDYIKASEKFKMTCLKIYLERCRLSTLCGFEMLQFADCLKYENKNGIVDCFDDDKYIPADWMRQFNNDAVLLADFARETYAYGEEIACDVYVSDFLRQPQVIGGQLRLAVNHSGTEEIIYDGKNVTLAGGLQKVASVSFAIRAEGRPQQIEFTADFQAGELHLSNSWKLWIYPEPVFTAIPELRLDNAGLQKYLETQNVTTDNRAVMTDCFDEQVFAELAGGKDVILLYHRDNPANKFYLPGALERCKPCIWDRGSNLGGIVYDEFLREAMASGRYFDINWYGLLEGGYKVCLDDFPVKVEEKACGIDKPVRDRMKGLVSNCKDFIDQDTLRNFSHFFSLRFGKATLTVCTFALTRLEDPSVRSFLGVLLGENGRRQSSAEMSLEDFRNYVQGWTVRPPLKEDVMNHFWEIDNKLVEDTLFWQEANLDLTKIK